MALLSQQMLTALLLTMQAETQKCLISNLKKDPNFTQTSLDQAKPDDVVAFEYTKKDGTKKGT